MRALQPADLPTVLRINQAARPALGDLDASRLEQLVGWCAHALVIGDSEPLAFMLAMEPGQPYASPNYRWFEDRFSDHVYVDRLAVQAASRDRGLGRQLYEALFLRAPQRRVTCEVNLVPANDGSLRFHHRLGFVQVGVQSTEGGKKQVSLLAREP